jgi:chitinase
MVFLRKSSALFAISLGVSFIACSAAYGDTCNSNLVSYWGQNSYGGSSPTYAANWQERLSYYCNDDSVDVFPIAFLDVLSASGGLPELNLANTCSDR